MVEGFFFELSLVSPSTDLLITLEEFNMFKNLILKKVTILIFILLQTAQAEIPKNYLNEKHIEDVWTVRVNFFGNSPESVIAEVNGKISHGDRLRIRVPIEAEQYCDYGNIFTTLYTATNNPGINELEGKIIPAIFKNEKVNLKIITSMKAMLGNIVFIDMGWNDIQSIKNYFQNLSQVSMELKNGSDIKTLEYFDIPKNTFILNGLDSALDKAKNECLKIVKENDKIKSELTITKNEN